MAFRRISGLGLALATASATAAAAVTVLGGPAAPATAGPAKAASPPPRPALSAELMPACGPGDVVNLVQAALGQPRATGPATPEAAVAEFAAVVGLALPTDALQRTVTLSDNEALVRGLVATGHAVRHGNHWQADYLATCVPAVPKVPSLPVPEAPSLPVPEVPSVPAPAPEVPDTPVPMPVPDPPGRPGAPTATTPSALTELGQ